MKYYIYLHFKKGTNIPFYIGKGSNNRLNHTIQRSEYWKRYVNKYGFESSILEYAEDEEHAFELEKYWISQFKCWGFKLINLTDGGDGCSWWTGKKRPDISEKFKGHKVTDEARKKMSDAKKGKRLSPSTEFKKGMIPHHAGKSKYTLFKNNKPAEYRICFNCNNQFISRIDKPTKFCTIKCSNIKRYAS